MNKFARKISLLTAAAVTAISLAGAAMPTKAQSATTVNWFVGLGTGSQPEQQTAEQAVVDKFNASQKDVVLKVTFVDNKVAPDALSTLIAAGNAPDIVGPVGVAGSNSFPGEWLDLKPEITKTKYNLAQFPDAVQKIYAGDKGAILGIPFAVYPGVLFYNVDLFTAAGLAMPPAKYGDMYKLDGKDVPWDYDTIAIIGKRLTFDANGNDATSAKFDPTKIVQFGFAHQWDTMRADFETFGGAPVIDATTGKVNITPAWRAEAQWLWNGIWKDHFIPNATYVNSDLMKPSAFDSGKLAMARVPLWYTCCMSDLKAKFDIAPAPAYKGTVYSPADADTFRVDKHTKNPDATFTALQYLLGDGALDLLTAYGAFPARPDLQAPFIKKLSDKYPSVTNWAIIGPSFAFAAVPHHESAYPNFNKGQQRFADFNTLIYADGGDKVDVAKELDKLQSDLQAIVDQGDQPITAPTMAATAAK